MAATNLRALAKDYANGAIDRENYRKQRTALIEGILAGDIQVEQREFIAPVEAGEDTDITVDKTSVQPEPQSFKSTGEFDAPKPAPATPPKSGRENTYSRYWIIGSAIIIVICFIVIAGLLLQSPEEESAEAVIIDKPLAIIEEVIEPVTRAPAVDTIVGQALIDRFLADNNWNENSIRQFVSDWQQLPEPEQDALLSSPHMTRLTNAVYQQLLQERALIGLADARDIMARQEMLVGFADTLGVRDARLTVQEVNTRVTSTPDPAPAETAATDIESPDATPPAPAEPEPDPADSPTDKEVETAPEAEASVEPGTTEDVTPAPEAVTGPDIEETTAEAESALTTAAADTQTAKTDKATGDEATTPASDTPAAATSSCTTKLARQRQPYCRDNIADLGKAPTMVVVPAGNFTMGGEKSEEQPQHDVTISKPFAISVNEITQAEFELFCQDIGRQCPQQPWSGMDYPVVNISWHDAVAYTRWQSAKTGFTYRLPTEAEWEYAARGGTRTPYPYGEEVLITDAVFSGRQQLNSPLPKSDRSINRNKFRLYHMVGNVREWVMDTWQNDYNGAPADGSAVTSGNDKRVVRGGSYADPPEALRSAARLALNADAADEQTGFRIVQELSQ